MNVQREFRCINCNHLLGKYSITQGSFSLFIKCRKCKAVNASTFEAPTTKAV